MIDAKREDEYYHALYAPVKYKKFLTLNKN